jgi:GNAT superfamily N-acetyltransferase
MYPAPRYPADGDRRIVHSLGTVALAGRYAAGLCLAAIPDDAPKGAEVLSLFVDPAWRGRGLATELLAQTEVALSARGVELVEGTYTTGKAATTALERVLVKRAWNPPVLRTVSVRFTPEEARTTPWWPRAVMPRDAEIIAWQDVTAAEKQQIFDSHAAKPWIAEGLEPWAHEKLGYEPASSVAMRLKGQIVGWVINHQMNPETVRFTLSYMRPDLARRAAILPLYKESIERVSRAGGRYCMFVTPVDYKGMVDFVLNHCAKWIGFVGETRGVSKSLAAATGP